MTEQNTTLATALQHVMTSLATLLDLLHELEKYDSPDNDTQPTVARHKIVLHIAETEDLFRMKYFQQFIDTYTPEAMQELNPVKQETIQEVVQTFQTYVRVIAKREGRSIARDLAMSFSQSPEYRLLLKKLSPVEKISPVPREEDSIDSLREKFQDDIHINFEIMVKKLAEKFNQLMEIAHDPAPERFVSEIPSRIDDIEELMRVLFHLSDSYLTRNVFRSGLGRDVFRSSLAPLREPVSDLLRGFNAEGNSDSDADTVRTALRMTFLQMPEFHFLVSPDALNLATPSSHALSEEQSSDFHSLIVCLFRHLDAISTLFEEIRTGESTYPPSEMARFLNETVVLLSWHITDLDELSSGMHCAAVLSLSCADIAMIRQSLRRFRENLCAIIDALQTDSPKQAGVTSSPFASWPEREKLVTADNIILLAVQFAAMPIMPFFQPVLPLSDPRFVSFLENFQSPLMLLGSDCIMQTIAMDQAIGGLAQAIQEFLACQKDTIAKLENPEQEISQAEAFTSVMDLTTSMQSVFFAVNALQDILAYIPGTRKVALSIVDEVSGFFDGIRFIQENVFEKLPTFNVVGSEENLSPRDWLAEQHRGILHVFLNSLPYRELRDFLDKLTAELDSQD